MEDSNTQFIIRTIHFLVPAACLLLLNGCFLFDGKKSQFSHINDNFKSTTQTNRYHIKQDRAPLNSSVDFNKIPEPKPKPTKVSKYGNPKKYKIGNQEYKILNTHIGYKAKGLASWYGEKFHGYRTSSGETYDMYKITAAHKTLPIPCYAKITNLKNGKSIIVKINDRGPFNNDPRRILDLSYAAAGKLGVLPNGTASVQVETIHFDKHYYLHVGSFKSKENALQVLKHVQNHFPEDSSIETKQHNLHTVIAGPFLHEHESQHAFNTLMHHNIGKPIMKVEYLN